MADDLEKYRGREQSYIKHAFLTQYLQAAAYKILQGRSPIFNFVDAFAGPWRVSDEQNYSDASFHQALQILEAVRADLARARRGTAELKIRCCFCERNPDAFNQLCDYAASHGQFDIRVFKGPFEDHLDAIADVCRGGFTFSFIDPTGWNIRSEPILEFLKKQRGEFLLNFMAEPVNRHVEYAKVAESFGRFLADPAWVSDFNALSSEWANEERVLHLLRKKIKKIGAADYVPDFPILNPREERVKMRLLLGTFSTKGLEVFRDVQWKVEKKEIETRNRLRNGNKKQISLFTNDEVAALQQREAGVGCPGFQREAKDRIVKRLTEKSPLPFKRIAMDILELVPMRLTQIRTLVKDMKNGNVVSFDLPPGKRVPQEDTMIFRV